MVTIYSTVWCGFCHAAKHYLDRLGVKYEDKNVEHDAKAAHEAVSKSGQMGVPVIDVDGIIIIGFDRQRLDMALREKNLL
jgi:glutaredoxin 3